MAPEEIKTFTQWIIENIDETIVPADEGNYGALTFNLVHSIRGDNERIE